MRVVEEDHEEKRKELEVASWGSISTSGGTLPGDVAFPAYVTMPSHGCTCLETRLEAHITGDSQLLTLFRQPYSLLPLWN